MAACGASDCARQSSPSAPTTALLAGMELPSPDARDITLTGRITEAPPTSTTGVWDATVMLDDGIGSWQSAKTVGGVGRGLYSIPGLHPGRFHATVSADGFVTVTRDVSIAPGSASDFQLVPVAVRKSVTVSDRLDDHGGTCSDGTESRPCHIVALPVHNSGSIEATLTWTSNGPALTLALFESGLPGALAMSTTSTDGRQRLLTDVRGGVVYEVRVIYASGQGTASYLLNITYPN